MNLILVVFKIVYIKLCDFKIFNRDLLLCCVYEYF